MQRVIGRQARPSNGKKRQGKPGISKAYAIMVGIFPLDHELQHCLAGAAMLQGNDLDKGLALCIEMLTTIRDNMRLDVSHPETTGGASVAA